MCVFVGASRRAAVGRWGRWLSLLSNPGPRLDGEGATKHPQPGSQSRKEEQAFAKVCQHRINRLGVHLA